MTVACFLICYELGGVVSISLFFPLLSIFFFWGGGTSSVWNTCLYGDVKMLLMNYDMANGLFSFLLLNACLLVTGLRDNYQALLKVLLSSVRHLLVIVCNGRYDWL